MRQPSLRTRATALGTLVFAALLGVGAFLLIATLDSRLTQSSDQVDRARVRELLQLAESGDLPETLRNVHDNAMAQVVGPDGTVHAASANLAGRPAVADLEATGSPSLATFEAPDDQEVETYRVWYASGESPVRAGHGLRRQQPGDRRRGDVGPAPHAVARRTARGRGPGPGHVGADRPRPGPPGPDQGGGRPHLGDEPGPAGGRRRGVGRGRPAGAHDERDAGPSRDLRQASARVRGRRVARPAEPVDGPAHDPGAGAGQTGRDRAAHPVRRHAGRHGRDGAARRRPARPGLGRRGSRRPNRASSTSTSSSWRRRPGFGRSRRSASTPPGSLPPRPTPTRGTCVGSSATCSRTRWRTRRRSSRWSSAQSRTWRPSTSSTTVPASTLATGSGSSTASTAPTPRVPAAAEAASVWRSRAAWPSGRAATSGCSTARAVRNCDSLSRCPAH